MRRCLVRAMYLSASAVAVSTRGRYNKCSSFHLIVLMSDDDDDDDDCVRGVPEMRLQQLVDRMGRRQLAHHGHHERFDDEVRLQHVRHGELDMKVRTANPQLRHDPVLRMVARGPDRIVGSRSLMELDSDGNEIASGVSDDEQDEWSGQEALVGVAVDCRNV